MAGLSEDMRAVSKKTVAAFDRFYKLLACIALLCIMAPLAYTVIGPIAGEYSLFISATVAPALFIAGYAVQALFGAVIRFERRPYSRAYEKVERYFVPSFAALTLTLCVILGIVAYSVFLREIKSGLLGYPERASAIPLLVGILTSGICAAGVVAWFYPAGYILSMRTSFVYMVLFLGDFVLNAFVFHQSNSLLVACLGLFLFCALVVMNQNHIVSVINSTGTGIVTPRVRYYNLISVGIICLFVALTVPIVLAILVGSAVLGKMLLFFILRNTVGPSEDEMYMDASEQAARFGNAVFGQFEDVNQTLTKLLFFVFLFILLGTILFFIVVRRRNILKAIIDFLDALFTNIMEFLANIFEFNKYATERFVLSDYRDVETKTDKSAIKDYAGSQILRQVRSYRDFLRRLEAIADRRERLVFAYSELVRCWDKKYGVSIRDSDTPAEIELKVSAVSSDTHAEPITRAFEYVKYAERELPESESARLIAAMCAQIRRAYDD